MTKMMKAFFAVALVALFAAMSSPAAASHYIPREDFPTIVEIAAGNDNFDTLVAAVQAAGLVDTLNGPGPFTVFAPTDAAFAKLPKGTLDALLADPKGALTQVLLYHVVSGDIGADTAFTLSKATTVGGQQVMVKNFEGDIYLDDDSKVIMPDIIAENGRIHVIDTVLIPPSMRMEMAEGTGGGGADMPAAAGAGYTRPELPTIVSIAANDGRFDTLVSLVKAAGLVDTLNGPGPYTVFAPTDAAFAKLPKSTVDALMADPKGALTNVLLYHVVSGDVGSEIAKTLRKANTVGGAPVNIKVFQGNLYINDDSKVIVPDVVAANGVIHAIDTVLIPPSMRSSDAADMAKMDDADTSDSAGKTIVDVAVADGRFKTLVTAVQAAGLVNTLSGPGPYTVFAPTDAAFAKLPKATLDALLADPNGALRQVLLYHVIPGDVSAEIARTLRSGNTAAGQMVNIKVFEGNLYLNDDSKVIIQDILTSNGRIHVIDTVLIPPSMADSE